MITRIPARNLIHQIEQEPETAPLPEEVGLTWEDLHAEITRQLSAILSDKDILDSDRLLDLMYSQMRLVSRDETIPVVPLDPTTFLQPMPVPPVAEQYEEFIAALAIYSRRLPEEARASLEEYFTSAPSRSGTKPWWLVSTFTKHFVKDAVSPWQTTAANFAMRQSTKPKKIR